MIKRRVIFLLLLAVCINPDSLSAQSGVRVYEENWTIPGYKFPEADMNPVFFRGEAYQGASKVIYPYKLNDNIIGEKEEKILKTVILENEYIKVCITPEIGGKLYYATDKTNGYHFIYKNNTFKPANIGMTGAWVSGGIEWCLIHHHRASTFLPVDYTMEENEDGSKTVWVGETEPRQRMRWTVGITVFPGKSYFQAEVKIHNRTPFTHSFLYWANVATHVNENYQVLFPPSTQFAVYHAKNSFSHWPVADEIYNGLDYRGGIDLSWWKNHPEPISFFAYDLQEDFMGGYDHGSETGTVNIGNHDITRGAKLWEWGNGKKGRIWDKALSDTDGPYAELMVGAFSDNQPDYSWIKPYEVKTFKQYWYPVRNIRGFKNATLDAAINLELKEGKAFLACYTTALHHNARLILQKKGETIFNKEITLSPKQPFSQEITVPAGTNETELKAFLSDSGTGDTLIVYQPKPKTYIKELPPVVEPPKKPSEIKTNEELFLVGKRIQQFHNATLDPLEYYGEALKRDPSDVRTNTAMGATALKNYDFNAAKKYLRAALKRLTFNYTRPETCEALYLLGLALKIDGEYESAIDTLYRATWDYTFTAPAYQELAEISCAKGEFNRALEQVDLSLAANPLNNSAISLKANILRHLGREKDVPELLTPLLRSDPLDFYALYESCLSSGKDRRQMEMFKTRMRGFDQNYLELAAGYIKICQWKEMKGLLDLYLEETANGFVNPLVYYYQGFIADKMGDSAKAGEWYRKASSMPVDYCFPFRFETIPVLEKALRYTPESPEPYYYLGNLLFDHQPENAMRNWEKAVKLDPALAIAWRNLGWGHFYSGKDLPAAINAYEKAIQAKGDDPLYYAELDGLYELSNAPLDKRIALFRGKHDVNFKRGDSFYRETLVLNLQGEYRKAIEYLAESKFQIREGENHLRETNVDAHLLYGRDLLAQGKPGEALKVFQKAHFMPGTSMEPQLGDDELTPWIDYFIGQAYLEAGNKKKSREYLAKITGYDFDQNSFLRYYQGMALQKTGEKEKAVEIFKSMVQQGDEMLNRKETKADFFAKYGRSATDDQRKSNALLIKGLGLKGLNRMAEANECLEKATGFNNSNLWARAEMK